MLGPLEVVESGALVTLTGRRSRQVLAVLAAEAGNAVSTDRLIDAVWGPAPPASARTQVSIQVSGLRRAFAGAGAPADAIETTGTGYRLDSEAVRIDAHLAERALRDAAAAGRDEAVRLLRSALGLWRGRPYDDVELDVLEPVAHRLEELRLRIAEHLYGLELARGRAPWLIDELARLVDAAPIREGLRALLMTALWRTGRRAEALACFRDGRAKVVEELGVEPGSALRRLHQRILAEPEPESEPEPAPAPERSVVPAELPRASPGFSGRTAELERLTALLRCPEADQTVVVAVSGPGGIGKSELAVQAAHRAAADLPDGRLYVDLCGSTPGVEPVTPLAALTRMMRSLGADERSVPADPDEAAARFRSLTEGRRLLIVLDNARDAAQVAPLIPASRTCRVVITARVPLVGLAGVTHLPVEVLDEAGALAMAQALVDPVRWDRAAAAEMLRWCGGLPLAISIAAARLNSRPAWTLRDLADRLRDEAQRLDELATADRAVRVGFEASHCQLDPRQQRTFGLLGLLECADIGLPTAAALAGADPASTEAQLEGLVDVQLVDSPSPGRYRLHDLIRLYAREHLEAGTTSAERDGLTRRAVHFYLATARTACLLLNADATWRTGFGPDLPRRAGLGLRDRDEAYAWLRAESPNLPGVFRQAAALPDDGPRLVGALCAAVGLVLTLRGRAQDKLQLGRVALAAAAENDELRAIAHDCLGSALLRCGDPEQALHHLRSACDGFERAGNPAGAAVQLAAMATAFRLLGRLPEAVAHSTRAIEINRRIARRTALVDCLTSLGLTYRRMGKPDAELAVHAEAAAIAETLPERNWLANVLANLGEATRRVGRPAEALAVFARALDASGSSERTQTFLDAEIRWGIGRAHHDLGDAERAATEHRESARILDELGLIDAAERERIGGPGCPEPPEIIRRNT
ncbi:transcriptional regulator AfsR [Microlunatus parietis]